MLPPQTTPGQRPITANSVPTAPRHRLPWGRSVAGLLVVVSLVLSGCGTDETDGDDAAPEVPQPSDPWPLSSPPEDPLGWIADQRGENASGQSEPSTAPTGADTLELTVADRASSGQYLAAGAGVSFEATDLADERLSAQNPDLVRILREMDRPTLRFGGNSVDRRFFFTDADEPAPDDWPLNDGERITTVTPEDLERLADLAEATDADVVLSVNLAADDPDRAADLVRHADQALGDRLVGIMIGNEPNGFALGKENPLSVKDSDWDTDAFIDEWARNVSAIRESVPDARIVGPGAYDAEWWRTVTESEVEDTVLAVHQYPLSECGDEDDTGYQEGSAPTIENTVSAETRQRVDRLLGRAVEIADEAEMPTWVTETSASSCSGSNDLTETLAAGLYSADYLLRAQRLGVDRVDFHSSLLPCRGGPPMSVVCSSGTLQSPGEAFVPRLNGLALALVGSLPEGEFLQVSSSFNDGDAVAGSQGEQVTSYAIRHDDGALSIVVVDFRDPSDAEPAEVSVAFPQSIASASVTALSGDSWTQSYPETTLFDGPEPTEGPTTADDDGVAMDVRGAVEPVESGRPSVDGYGFPLLPPRLQTQVAGVESGDREITTTITPGSVSVISTKPL